MDKVHGPGIIDAGSRIPAFSQLRPYPSFGRFLPQLQADLLVKYVDPLAVDLPVLTPMQHMDSVIAVPNPFLRDLLYPLLEVGLIATPATIVVAE